MKKLMHLLIVLFAAMILMGCDMTASTNAQAQNRTAHVEQQHVERNQARLNQEQPAPKVTWSLERESLITRFKMMNDRSIVFYMYIFPMGATQPVGYYQVMKVSSVNSQLTNPEQIIMTDRYDTAGEGLGRSVHVVPSPAEDGSYGTNGDAVFGFTPDDVYIEHNMQYICASVPLNFSGEIANLGSIGVAELQKLQKLMDKIRAD